MKIRLPFLFFSLLLLGTLHAQNDTVKLVEILPGARKLELRKIDANTEVQILAGNVRLKQDNAIFYCDSCIINNQSRTFEAFGNVHINDDTTDVYSDYLRYRMDTRMAYLKGKVRLSDGHGTLTTNELEYDVANGIGIYKNGGKVVNKKSVLTSREGIYYSDLHDIYFKGNVELKDPAYYLKTDSLLYNTESESARFIADTYLRDSAKRTIRTTEGYYDMRTGTAQFTQRTTIEDGAVRIVGDKIASDDASGLAQILGNAILIDTAQGVNILANEIFADRNKEAYLATRKPLMIIRQDKDSIYITADTLFSARLSDRFPGTDSAKGVVKKTGSKTDSTDRYFEAFNNVRIFSDSVQAVSDSLFYSFRDSVFQLYQDPLVWASGSQISGDTIHLFTRNKKAERIKVFENSFIINELDPGVFNQVKSTRMDGFFIDGVIDSVRAAGAAESVYYIQDEDSAYTGVNQTASEIMDVYFTKGDLKKVVFRTAVKGTLWPASEARRNPIRLQRFKWQEGRRPKTKYELYE